jgi:hypothetical protein
MKQPCGCCSGIQVVTPQPEINRPGLPALSYRVGTYATFFESMLARLSSLYIDLPPATPGGAVQRIWPLKALTTREQSDPSIALLDAWAVVADVLTFYQERITNEGYLPTAVERRSMLELARLIGYELRPGVSASVFLAFTVATGFNGTLPKGTRAQSIPPAGQTSQFFETAIDLPARDVWNSLSPRLTRPQVITLSADPGTDAATRETLYFQGITTNLKTGDQLLIVLGQGSGLQVPRLVDQVTPQPTQNRTLVTLQMPPVQASDTGTTASQALNPFIDEATSIFAGNDLAQQVAQTLTTLVADVKQAPDGFSAASIVQAAIPQIQQQNAIAQERSFTRLQTWTDDLLTVLQSLVQILPKTEPSGLVTNGHPAPIQFVRSRIAPAAFANLVSILDPLSQPPSLQPANSIQLVRTIAQAFSAQSDVVPRMLATFRPAAATTIYQALGGIATPSTQVYVYAMRAKAAPFGNNAPKQMSIPPIQTAGNIPAPPNPPPPPVVPIPVEWPLSAADQGSTVSLDSVYDKITPGSWVIVESSDQAAPLKTPLITQAVSVVSTSRADYGTAAKVTQVDVGQAWLPPSTANPADITELRRVTVWAQPELLALTDEPLDQDVEANSIELAQLYDGLNSGKWIIVSGERTDIPNTTGVQASELVMISGVAQGSRGALCVQFPSGLTPFTQVYYTTAPNASGDQLVVGKTTLDLFKQIQQIPVANAPNQLFCDQVQLAAGLNANAYVPTKDERTGNFNSFTGLLVDPNTGEPFPGGIIPTSLIPEVFAWRISSAPVHTILTLANDLSYTYDSSSVTIYANVAPATNGQTVGEVLGDGDASQAFQKFALHQKPLTYVSAPTPAGAQSTLSVTVNDITWHEKPDLASLTPGDHGYITQTDNSAQTTVIFGNGEHGARVPTGSSKVKAVYRYGIGSGGNVAATLISQLATHPLGAQGVINPLPATGGADADTLDQARRNAPFTVLALDRLVSVSDYADFARTFAGIGKASSTRISDGRKVVVYVTIAGAEDIPIDTTSALYSNLIQALQQFGDPNLPIQVAVRRLKLLVMNARVALLADFQWESVEPQIRTALLNAFGFDQRDLGQSAFLSEAVSVIQNVEGVSYVDFQVFDSVSENVTAAQLAQLANTLGLNNFVEAELARIDPTATDPAKHILPAELAILTPDIPDMLILTEITS